MNNLKLPYIKKNVWILKTAVSFKLCKRIQI
jgi:hypothetical protein